MKLGRLLHWNARQIEHRLDQLTEQGIIEEQPTHWQLFMGVLYMYHRAVFRPDTIGVDPEGVERETLMARMVKSRVFRAPFVLGSRSVNPLDHTGLASSRRHLIRHLLGAYHPGDNFHYDLQIVALDDGALEELRELAASVVDGTHPWARFYRDLVVYEGYHERLLDAVDRWLAAETPPEHDNPDTTLDAFLAWCLAQPATPARTLKAALRGQIDFTPRVPSAA